MLSRIGDSLFWIGRYLERAEDSSRILDVHLQSLLDDPTISEEYQATALLLVMGFDPAWLAEREINAQAILDLLCYDINSPSSLRAVISALRESARRVRETISTDLWESVNTAYLETVSASFEKIRPITALQRLRLRCIQSAGIADETMTHDEGYHFMMLGRNLERVDMTSRLISTVAASNNPRFAWHQSLRACGGYHAFIRTHGGVNSSELAARFLIQDRRFPRSLAFGLMAVEESLAALGSSTAKDLMDRPTMLTGRTRAQLEYLETNELTQDLAARMEQIQRAVAEISSELTSQYFEGADAPTWTREVLTCA